MKIEGTIVYVSLGTGFWGITTDGGKKFIPTNLPEGMKKDGLDVLVKARSVSGQTGMHMWGDYIRIMWIGKIN